MQDTSSGYDIAVIGIAGRFPGARDVDEFWRNLRNGVESVTFFKDEELLAAGESPDILGDPSYVKAQPVLEGFDRFDAAFFGFSPQDAAIMDPQHRVFLEVGWEALENAGHESESFPGTTGVFATCGMNTYMMYSLVNNRRIMDTVGEWLVRHTGNDMNFLATRLSYELNLKGPSLNVQTACSSALVAIHMACQSLLTSECDMALAGGSTIVLPQGRGYHYKPGEILAPDGHCRAFDAKASGTLFGSGAGVVVLRRLADAVADGDRILAVIKGSALTNDGSDKVGYLAPSVEGQAKAVTEALVISGVDPETISYIETHGTGTIIGDPIEVTALTQAFRQFTERKGFCAIGSLKSNIGHLGEAAGIAAFIKTVLALNHREIPPSLHYESPNPQIDFASSPFFVNQKLVRWQPPAGLRRAGITSLGAGGTNCHVIVEEPPLPAPSSPARPRQLLLLSASTPSALETATESLATHLKEHPEDKMADVAYTLHVGRKAFAHRRALVCRDQKEAIAALQTKKGVISAAGETSDRAVTFLFPGQGAQYPNMGRELYESESVFRAEVDRCAEILKRHSGVDLRDVIFSSEPSDQARQQLNQTAMAQSALFLIEYALAKLWMSWGVQPRAMIGHSLGEYVAACLAGVFSLADALALVADRGRLMQQAARGAMTAVPLPAAEIEQLLSVPGASAGLSLAVVNGPALSVVSGPDEAVAALEAKLSARGVQCQRLQTSHAFHSAMMDPILPSFGGRVRRVPLHSPAIPYLSNLTGTWIRPEEATDPDYWVRHLRNTVRFSECLATLLEDPDQILLEVGPGRTLCKLARQQSARPAAALPSLGSSGEGAPDLEVLLKSCGHMWVLGCKLDGMLLYKDQRRRRVSLPTYPFERQRYWIEADPPTTALAESRPVETALVKKPDIADWFFQTVWTRSLPPAPARRAAGAPVDWLVFLDEGGLGSELIQELRQAGPAEEVPEALRLEIATPGDVDGLALKPTERLEPGPGEVEIRVRATALNFADALKAVGVFPDAPFGMECAGRIERVGSGVTGFRQGDEVVAIGPGSFCSYVVRDARLVAHKPEFLSIPEAVTLPAAFMTAWYSLHHIGKLRPGEKVLIHAATGGVGLAAIQVARLTEAEIFATAGSKEKRAYLKSLGIRHVFDSRSLGFADEVMQRTRGQGVDVVLNSLTGEFIHASLSVLARGGRFLEIGKKEIYSPDQIAAMPLRPKVSYHPIDLTLLLRDDPDAYGALLQEVVDLARQRRIEPLRRHEFAFSEAALGFSLMLQTRHMGKVVLSLDPPAPRVWCVRAGAGFRRLSPHEYVVNPGRAEDYLALLEALEQGSAALGRIVHLWNVTAESSGGSSLERCLERGFLSLTWLAKALGSRGWTQPIDLAVVSTGLKEIAGEARVQPVKATLLGPCCVIPREFPEITCRSIDLPATAPGTRSRGRVVRQLLAELSAAPQDRIIAYRNADRWVQGYQSTPLGSKGRGVTLRRGGVYLITGGLGGLGLEFARHLARTVQANLVLVGRSALPARTDWNHWLSSHEEHDTTSEKIRGIQECEALGGTVLLVSADVTDRKRMRSAIAQARRQFGAIHGVFQAAGTLDDGLIQLKTPESALGVLAPKVKGTLILDELLRKEALDFFVLFSSVSSILGLEGQVDYTAANAFLDAFASYRSVRGAGQTVAINWSAWRESGMAARNVRTPRDSHPDANADGDATQRPRHPWLDRRHDHGRGTDFFTEFSRSRQWLLDEHAVHGGDALIPGTGFLELARAAFSEVENASVIEMSNVCFQAPFAVAAGASKELAVTLQPVDSMWDFRFHSQSGSVTNVTGRIASTSAPRPERINLAAVADRCTLGTEQLDGFLRQPFMDFGRRWGNVRQIRFGRAEALLSLQLPPECAADLATIPLHPAMLDMATGGAQALIPGFDATKDFYIPFSYGRLVLWEGFPQGLFSHIRLRDARGQGLAVFDITVTDEDGAVVAEISEFVMRRIADLATIAAHRESPRAATRPSAAGLAGEALRHGIAPGEGVEAFERILASGVSPQIIVSSVDLHLWMKKLDESTEAKTPSAMNPAISAKLGPAASARANGMAFSGDPVENRLASMYSELLGVEKVGRDDDFFELGGHSLLGVRLLARIQKEFKKAIPLPLLFQSGTIAALAAFLRGVDGSKRKESGVIVPFNESGEGPAFFCVHSVGGEVMRFRHLSRHLGPDQRFFGIQAPPEMRNAQFASSIVSMARYYVDALIEFQPEGPYVLGGWSAGSTIAFEMAQQLKARDREVELLIALDGAPNNSGAGTSPWHPLYHWKLLCNFPRWIADDFMVDFSFPDFASRVWRKLRSLSKTAAGALHGGPNSYTLPVESYMDTSVFSDHQVEFMNSLNKSLNDYVPKNYSGRVHVYKSRTEPLYHLFEVELAWSKIASEVEVVPVRGTHLSLIDEPYVGALAADLKTVLNRIRREATEPGLRDDPACEANGTHAGVLAGLNR